MSEERLNRMLSSVSDEFSKSEDSFYYDNFKSVDIELDKVDAEIEESNTKLDIRNLTGNELTQRVYERTGIKRKLATYGTTTVTISGTPGASIIVNDKVASDTLNFIFKESKTLDSSGYAEVLVECEMPGSVGNVPAGTIKYFPVTLSGLTSVTNPNSVTNGYAEESDADLLDRYFERLQTPATSNNKAQLKGWAKEITGVGDARVFSLWAGDDTAKVVIIDSNKQPASNELVVIVQEHIDPGSSGLGDGMASIGLYCTVESASGKAINVSFTADKDNSVTDEVRLTNVRNNITNYFKTISFNEDEPQISYAKISAAIMGSIGILDISDLLINGGISNIPLSQVLPVEVPMLGVVTIA
jgi:uncharacterized phage protein gp47/JayE